MHRIDTSTAQIDKFGPGKNGFTNGDQTIGRRATDLNSDMWDAVQEELCNVIESSGLALDKEQHNQLYQAIMGMITSKIPDALIRNKNLSDVVDKAAALANLNGVPKTRKVNGHPLSEDASITAQDIFNDQALSIGDAVDLNSLQTPGLYYQATNAQAGTGQNYPEVSAGSLVICKHAGITQIYRVYNNSRSYVRTFHAGVWLDWTKQYDAGNRPTADEVGALALNGTAVAASKLATARTINGISFDGTKNITISAGQTGAYTKEESDAQFAPLVVAYTGIGAYILARSSTDNIEPGANVAGSSLRASTADGSIAGDALPGTWRCMGYMNTKNDAHRTTLWMRIL